MLKSYRKQWIDALKSLLSVYSLIYILIGFLPYTILVKIFPLIRQDPYKFSILIGLLVLAIIIAMLYVKPTRFFPSKPDVSQVKEVHIRIDECGYAKEYDDYGDICFVSLDDNQTLVLVGQYLYGDLDSESEMPPEQITIIQSGINLIDMRGSGNIIQPLFIRDARKYEYQLFNDLQIINHHYSLFSKASNYRNIRKRRIDSNK